MAKKSAKSEPAASTPPTTPEPEVKALALTNQVQPTLDQVHALAVKDDNSCNQAIALLTAVNKLGKDADAQRRFFVDPLMEQVKKINALFKPMTSQLEDTENLLRAKVGSYRAELQRAADKEAADKEALAEQARAKAAAAVAAGRTKTAAKAQEKAHELTLAAAQVVQPARSMQVGNVNVAARRVWDFEIVDASKLPREYLVENLNEIRAAVRAGVREIPGLRIFPKEILAVGGR